MADDADRLRAELQRVATDAIAARGRILGLSDQAVIERIIRPYFRALPLPGAAWHLVDVGAAYGNVAAVFLSDGWTADLLEPDPACQRLLQPLLAGYGDRVRLSPFAAAGEDRDAVRFEQNTLPGLSSLVASPYGSSAGAITVRSVRLDSWLAAAGVARVDFLKIDTEGSDLVVLETHDFARLPPALVFVEYSYLFAGQDAASLRGAVAAMRMRGYDAVIFDYDDDGNFRRGIWTHRLVALSLDAADIPTRPESFGNVLFYRRGDGHLLRTLAAVIPTLA